MSLYLHLISNISRGESLSEFADLCCRLIQNPIMICDASFFVLAYSQNEDPDDYVWQEIIKRKYSPEIFVKQSDIDHFYRRVKDTMLPLFVDERAFESEHRRAVGAVYDGSTVSGYITVLEYESPITEDTLLNMKLIAELLSIRFKEDHLASNSFRKYRNDFVVSILSGNMIDPEMVATRAAYLNVSFYHYFAVLGIEALGADYSSSYSDQVKNVLLHWFPTCIYSHLENKTYYIVSYPEEGAWKDIQNSEFLRYLSHENLICIMSDFTDDIMKVSRCFSQVRQMEKHYLHCRMPGSPRLIVYSYDVIFSILENIENGYLEEVYERLRASDASLKTEYCRTLETFFKKNQNISDTAAALHIHRNTAIYRLARIRELLGLDFDDYRVRLQLELVILKKSIASHADSL